MKQKNKKIYELVLRLSWRPLPADPQFANSEKEAKKEMLKWIRLMLKNDDILWRIQLTNTYEV